MRIRTLQHIAAALSLATSLTAHAARDFTPQAGTWIVSSELDGKPGRGLAIDVQGNTFFMQVFGYEKNGDATFYTATGTMDGDSVTAPLMRYTGGRSFGGSARDAVEDKSLGDVTVSFRNGLKGTVQFPGEPPVEMERFLVKDFSPSVSNPLAQVGMRGMKLLVLDEQQQLLRVLPASLSRNAAGQPEIGLPKTANGIAQTLPCTLNEMQARFYCVANAPALPTDVQHLDLKIVGNDIAGSVQFTNAPGQAFSLMGIADRADWDGGNGSYYQQNYLSISINGGTIGGSAPKLFHQIMPINGTWIVEDELTGKPGRGLALDVQDSTMVLQVFNYRADGQPTFHMGSGAYASAGANTNATRARFALNRYAGGRSLGGAAQSAHLQDEAGTVEVELALGQIDSNTLQGGPLASASVTLPGEAPKRIRRLQLDAASSLADQLFGEWYWARLGTTITFNREVDGRVTNADGTVVCWRETPNIPVVSCGEPDGALWKWVSSFRIPLLNRGSDAIQLRDRFGNFMGLGQVD